MAQRSKCINKEKRSRARSYRGAASMLAGFTVNSAESKQAHGEGDDQESINSSAHVCGRLLFGAQTSETAADRQLRGNI